MFDLVYARLSLHYNPVEELNSIFKEIKRILVPEGIFWYAAKTRYDSLKTDKTILSASIWKDLSTKYFKIISFNELNGILYDTAAT